MIRAQAPSRIDLAGGTLDIWPISLLVPGAVTVNLAIGLHARVTVRPRKDRKVLVRSVDRKTNASRVLPIQDSACRGGLSLLLRLIQAFEFDRGLELKSEAEAPAGAGLGGSSTLAVATGAALAVAAGRRFSKAALLQRVMNVEAREIGVPTGNQDYLAAIHGGLAAYRHTVDGVRREALPEGSALAERLVLAYTGQPRQSGFSNWAMFRNYVEGKDRAVKGLQAIGTIANRMVDALHEGKLDRVGKLLGQEGELRYDLAPTVSTPKLRRVGRAATAAGALGVKVCGAGGGGCLVAFAKAGRHEEVAAAMQGAGGTILPVTPVAGGVRVTNLER